MQRWTVVLAGAVLLGCQHEPGAGGQVQSVLMGSFSKSVKRHQRNDPRAVRLLNVTGDADSLLLLTAEDRCGFVAWSANSQSGPIGVEGRTAESFDLAHPRTWTSHGRGLRSGCQGGAIASAEAYFRFLDLHLALGPSTVEDHVVRVHTSQTGDARFGDLQVRDADGTFKWIDTAAGDALVSVRPAAAATYVMNGSSGPLVVPWFDDNGKTKMVMTKLPLTISTASVGSAVSPLTTKVVFDVDFSGAALTASDRSSAAKVARTLAIPFLTNIQSPTAQIQVAVTALNADEVDGPTDPAPGDGNGQIQRTPEDGGVSDGGAPDGG